MPSPYVKSLSKKINKSETEIEKVWKDAKQAAAKSLKKSVDDLTDADYALVTDITKKMLGIKEAIKPIDFLSSNKSVEDFLQEVTVSSNFTIGDVNISGKAKTYDTMDIDATKDDDIKDNEGEEMNIEGMEIDKFEKVSDNPYKD